METATVFIIENSFTKESGLADKFRQEGIGVRSAEGESAVEEAITQKPAIVVTDTDFKHPGEEITLLEKLKNADPLKETIIFVYTASLDIPLEVKLRKLKLDYFFTHSAENDRQVVNAAKKVFSMAVPVKEEPIPEQEEKYTKEEWNRFGNPLDDMETVRIVPKEDDDETDFNLAELLFEAGKYGEAEPKLLRLEKDIKYHLKAKMMLGVMYRSQKKLRDALEFFQRGAKETASEEEKLLFYYEIAMTLKQAGKFEDALRFFVRVHKHDKNFQDVNNHIHELQSKLGQA